ncbi:hypothetical protein Tco_1176025 [Tanacetum coccineum]
MKKANNTPPPKNNEAKSLSIDSVTTTTANNSGHQLLSSMPPISLLSPSMVCGDVDRFVTMVIQWCLQVEDAEGTTTNNEMKLGQASKEPYRWEKKSEASASNVLYQYKSWKEQVSYPRTCPTVVLAQGKIPDVESNKPNTTKFLHLKGRADNARGSTQLDQINSNFLPRLQELATAAKSTMMVDQVLVLTEKEIDKELKLEVKFRDLCSELANAVKNKAKYIEKLKRYPRLLDNVEAVKTACVLKHA